LYQQKAVVGGFADDVYWSSTEANGGFAGGYAWYQNFSNGYRYNDLSKAYTRRIRVIRAF
jgi:hypothetical protein